MALDATARESNLIDSIKKYLVDNLNTTEDIFLSFDRFVNADEIVKTAPPAITRWVSVVFGEIDRDIMGFINVDLYCCTRRDAEGYRLAQLCDTVMGYLTDTDETDTMKRITLYRSRASGSWTEIGKLLVHEIIESPRMVAPDESKYKILTAVLRWSAKI